MKHFNYETLIAENEKLRYYLERAQDSISWDHMELWGEINELLFEYKRIRKEKEEREGEETKNNECETCGHSRKFHLVQMKHDKKTFTSGCCRVDCSCWEFKEKLEDTTFWIRPS